MNYIDSIITFGLLGLSAIFFQAKGELRLQKVLQLLLFGATCLFVVNEFDSGSEGLVYLLLSLVALNYALSMVSLFRKPHVRLIPVAVTMFGYLFYSKDFDVTFLEETNNMNGQLKFILTGLFLVVFSFEIGRLKLSVLHRIFGGLDDSKLMESVIIFIVGASYFLGGFGGGVLGVMLIAGAHLSGLFFREEDDRLSLPLNILIVIPLLIKLGQASNPILIGVDVVEGLFFGFFCAYFLQQVWNAEKSTKGAIALAYVFGLVLSIGILMLATQFEQMGGVDALVAYLIGVGLFEAVQGKGYISTSLACGVLALSIQFIPYTIDNTDEEAQKGVIKIDGAGSENMTWKSLEDIKGEYGIKQDSSKVLFEIIGKNDKAVHGVFNSVTGTIVIADNIENSKFDIVLPMSGFTTHKKMRDESLFGADYFNVAKFPNMSYSSSKIVAKGNGEYELHGAFTMIGVTKDLIVQLRRPDVGDRNILIGSGTIDRTQFGMSPSAIEGNTVTFDFQVELLPK